MRSEPGPYPDETPPGLAMPFFIVRRERGPLAWPALEPDLFADEREARAAALARGLTGDWWVVEAKDVREALRKASRER